MILIRFGCWSRAAGRWFMWNRLYIDDSIWTPFCRVVRRKREFSHDLGGDMYGYDVVRWLVESNELASWTIYRDGGYLCKRYIKKNDYPNRNFNGKN